MLARQPEAINGFAMVQPQRAMAKSPALRQVGDGNGRERRRSLDIGWQTDAYDLTREVGEAGYAAHLTANTLAKGEFRPRKLNAAEGEEEDERPARVMAALMGPRGGQTEIKRRLGLHTAIAGEFFLVGTTGYEDARQLGILWEALSIRELEITTDGRVTRRRDGQTKVDVAEDVYIARGLYADAEFSDRADSMIRRALPALREVAIHSQVIEASSKSRLAAGILFIPDEMSFGFEGEDDMDEDEIMDLLTDEILKHLSKPIEERAHPASWVPLVMRGKGEDGQHIRLIELGKPLGPEHIEMRDKALTRAMHMLDIPPEKVEGKANLAGLGGGNVAASIDTEFIDEHVVPKGDFLADFLTVAYMRPMLEAFENMTPEESAQWVVDYDPSGLKEGPDLAGDRALHALGLLSDQALMKSAGHEPNDMPDEEEIVSRKSWDLILRDPSLAPVLLPFVKGFKDLPEEVIAELADAIKQKAAAGQLPGQEGAAPGGEQPQLPAGQQPQQPEQPQLPPQPRALPPATPAAEAARIVERVAVACDSAIERAYERGQSRLVSRCQHSAEAKAAVAGKANPFVSLGPAGLASLGVGLGDLFGDAWDQLSTNARPWLRDYVEATLGYPAPLADDRAQLAISELCDRLTDWLAANLYRGFQPGANGLRVSNELVEEALALVLGAVAR